MTRYQPIRTMRQVPAHRSSAADETQMPPPNVVVSGWQIYDNKGQVVEKYEPFFDTGWDYLSLEEAERQRDEGIRNLFGQRVMQFYDPRGQVIRTRQSGRLAAARHLRCAARSQRSRHVLPHAVGSLHL